MIDTIQSKDFIAVRSLLGEGGQTEIGTYVIEKANRFLARVYPDQLLTNFINKDYINDFLETSKIEYFADEIDPTNHEIATKLIDYMIFQHDRIAGLTLQEAINMQITVPLSTAYNVLTKMAIGSNYKQELITKIFEAIKRISENITMELQLKDVVIGGGEDFLRGAFGLNKILEQMADSNIQDPFILQLLLTELTNSKSSQLYNSEVTDEVEFVFPKVLPTTSSEQIVVLRQLADYIKDLNAPNRDKVARAIFNTNHPERKAIFEEITEELIIDEGSYAVLASIITNLGFIGDQNTVSLLEDLKDFLNGLPVNSNRKQFLPGIIDEAIQRIRGSGLKEEGQKVGQLPAGQCPAGQNIQGSDYIIVDGSGAHFGQINPFQLPDPLPYKLDGVLSVASTVKSTTCSDTDQENYKNKGTITQITQGVAKSTFENSDSCLDRFTLKEWVCTTYKGHNIAEDELIFCSCKEGVC